MAWYFESSCGAITKLYFKAIVAGTRSIFRCNFLGDTKIENGRER